MQHDKKTVAAIRAAFADICRSLPNEHQATRDYVASRILKSASEGELTLDGLKLAGNIAVLELYAGTARI
ncbi:hypothetical protein [Bradyrhizobium sp. SYSU BS000235]|uniref:hypothetical protein n=1 Tax=Bradyrhizobium sp. SYSU BS000235 TaxID=3411332 RepID=UPI003C7559B0